MLRWLPSYGSRRLRAPAPVRPRGRGAVRVLACAGALFVGGGGAAAAQGGGEAGAGGGGRIGPAAADAGEVPPLFGELRFRSIGPAVTGGRIDDIEAVPAHPATVYVAAATGGLWRTTNGGTTWAPVLDRAAVGVFGDVALAPSDPRVVWAGTGEQNNRQSTSWGAGVYRSTDGGDTWRFLGLEATHHIGRIGVDPADPDVAYVAAQGDLWAPSPERGVYRTTDGGRTWRKVLYVDTLTGATDVVVDPTDGRTVYAATYQRLRRAWGFNGGGPGGGIWKTTDGGEHWTRLTNGLPAGPLGRIGLAISAQRPGVVVARVEHASEGGVYRSEDGGASWTRVSRTNPRPSYYGGIWIDPTDAHRVYLLSTDAYVSDDGGRTFRTLPTAPTYDVGVHSDHHALWIDPAAADHLYLGGDGGLYESRDRGRTWRKINNFAIGQIYSVGTDGEDPYNVYVGLQDNHSWMGPSATRRWSGILNEDWKEIGFGDGMYQSPDPTSPRYVYSNSQDGGYTRVDATTGDILDIAPRAPAGEPGYRWDWDSPSLVDRFDPKTVYVGGNRLFTSHDRGLTWSRTPDLTQRIDRDTLSLMGVRGSAPMLSKNDGTESYGEITTIAQSPVRRGVLWVGTDDGNVQVSRDGGATWSEVSRNLPRAAIAGGVSTYIARITASATAPGAAWVAVDGHRHGDFHPYLFRTTDFGRTWTPRVRGLAEDGTVNDVVEDPDAPGLLFAGTERALYVSADTAAHWRRFGANLPPTIYEDLLIEPRSGDLVVATHGRSVFILDDASPLAEWSPDVATERAHLFSIRPATIFNYWKNTSYQGQAAYAGENPAFGALLTYYLGEAAPGARITVRDARGDVVRTMKVAGDAGVIHRVAWDLRRGVPIEQPPEPRSQALPAPAHPLGLRGPFVSPGRYQVTLEASGVRSTQSVVVRPDPLMPMLTQEDYAARERWSVGLLDLMKRVVDASVRTAALRAKLTALRDSLATGGAPPAAITTRLDSVTVLEDRLGVGSRFRGLSGEIVSLYTGVNGAAVQAGSLYPPTPWMVKRASELEEGVERVLGELEREEGRR